MWGSSRAAVAGPGPDVSSWPLVLGTEPDRGRGTVLLAELEGELVWLRRLPVADATARAHMAVLAQRLTGPAGPGLVRVLDVLVDGEGVDLVLARGPVVGSLRRHAELGPLRSAEVVGLGLTLVDALASLHERGLTHGRLSAADVLIDADGSVRLTGYGVAGVLGSAGSAVEDADDLLGLLLALLPEHAPAAEPVRAGLRTAQRSGRGLDAIRQALEGCGVPGCRIGALVDPARSVAGAPGAHRAGHLGHRMLRRLRSTGRGGRVVGTVTPAALGVLLLAAWIGARAGPPADTAAGLPPSSAASPSSRPSPAPTVRAPTPTTAPSTEASATSPSIRPPERTAEQWRTVLSGLDAARVRLLAAPDEQAVASVDVPGSSAYAADLAVVRALRRDGLAVPDLRTDLVSVRVRSAGPERADLEVVDRLRPHHLVVRSGSRAGSTLETRAGRGARTVVYVLVRTDGADWRVAQLLPP